MRLATPALLSAIIGLALGQSLTVPDLPDGVYLLSLDADGETVWSALNATSAGDVKTDTPKRDLDSPVRRSTDWPSGTNVFCPGGDYLLENDFYGVDWQGFYSACADSDGHGFPRGTSLVKQLGTATSYMCAFGNAPCRPDEWADAVSWLQVNCWRRSNGWMEPGELPTYLSQRVKGLSDSQVFRN